MARMSLSATDYFAQVDALPVRPLDGACGDGGLLVVAPHPDDESLGCGGAIALAGRSGRRVAVIVVSDGAGSHPNSRLYPPQRLTAVRCDETREALACLGLPPESVSFLDLPDGAVPSSSPAAVAAIRAAAERVAAGAIFVTSPLDPHCDHQAAHALARQAAADVGCALYVYPIWSRTLPGETMLDVEAPDGFRLAIADVLDPKRRAIAAHRSQASDLIPDDPAGFRLVPAMIARFLQPFEPFVRSVP